MVRSRIFLGPFCLLVLLSSCEQGPAAGPIGQYSESSEWNIQCFVTDTMVARVRITIEKISSDGSVSGRWVVLEDNSDSFTEGDELFWNSSGRFEGQELNGLLWIDLNPNVVDHDVSILLPLGDQSPNSRWEFATDAGITLSGQAVVAPAR